MESNQHQNEIIDQFTSQAVPFAELEAHSKDKTLEVFRDLGTLVGNERILDSGCGPGLVTCYLAPFAAEVIGLDLTPAMVELGTRTARSRGIHNARFLLGDMLELPFPDDHFHITVSRYALHHLENPEMAFEEMHRVTKPGGKIIVLDATPEDSKKTAYNKFERLRDPSHTKALTPLELSRLGGNQGLGTPEIITLGLEMNATELVGSSFPRTVSRGHLLDLLTEDVDKDLLSFRSRFEEGKLTITFPLTAACWCVPL